MRYRTKVTGILLAVAGVAGGLMLWLSHQTASKIVFRLIQERVLAVAVSTAPQVDGDAHARLTREQREASLAFRDDENADYVRVRKPLRNSRDANQNPEDEEDSDSKAEVHWQLPVEYIYTIRPRTDGVASSEEPYEYVVDAQEDENDKSYLGDLVEFREGEDVIPEMGIAQADSVFAEDEFGTWLTAFAPVRDSEGTEVALLGVDVDAKNVIAQTNRLLLGGLIALAFAFAVAAIASVILSGMVTAPLRALHRQVALIREGDLTTRIPIESGDEFGELGEAIHDMADQLQEREAFKKALVRFVSSGASEPVAEARESESGRSVTVLAAGIRNLESISDAIPSDRVFAFLGEWYSRVVDVVLENRGSIERSSSDTITATFGAPLNDPDQERHAIEAALTLEQELASLCQRWEIETVLSLDAAIHAGVVNLSDEDEVKVLEFASLNRIIGAASSIRAAADVEGIVISETASERLKGAIPLSYLRSIEIGDSGEMLALHRVQMPKPQA